MEKKDIDILQLYASVISKGSITGFDIQYFRDILSILVRFKCDLNVVNGKGYSVLLGVCIKGRERILKELLEVGGPFVDITMITPLNGANVFCVLARYLEDNGVCNRMAEMVIKYAKKHSIPLGFATAPSRSARGRKQSAVTIAMEKGNMKFVSLLEKACW